MQRRYKHNCTILDITFLEVILETLHHGDNYDLVNLGQFSHIGIVVLEFLLSD